MADNITEITAPLELILPSGINANVRHETPSPPPRPIQKEVSAEIKNARQTIEKAGSEGKYSPSQVRKISELLGLDIDPHRIAITRSQSTPEVTRNSYKSCCVIMPGQETPYTDSGFIYQVKPELIPWVHDGDAGTPMSADEITTPSEAISLSDYLNKTSFTGQYNETYIDFRKLALEPKHGVTAVYFLKKPSTPPTFFERLLHPRRYKETVFEIRFHNYQKKRWQEVADQLQVPFITEFKNPQVMKKIQDTMEKTSQTFSKFEKSSPISP